jgi:hypothetical protein
MRRLFGFWVMTALGLALDLGAGRPALSARQAAGDGPRLTRLLERAKDYCLKLERAALDFTCFERIQEKTYRLPEIEAGATVDSIGRMGYSPTTPRMTYYAHNYVYDYQFVRKGDRKIERRTLIEEDGRKKKEADAALVTQSIRVENALFGPIGLVGDSSQAQHDYRIVGEDTRDDTTIVIIEASPKTSLDRPHCFGRVWVREDDGSVVKISWDQTSVGNFQVIQARAHELDAAPQLTSITEYGLEKNGLRFPSKDTTEEAYIKNGKKHVRSLTTILYKDYKFFTVETEIHY